MRHGQKIKFHGEGDQSPGTTPGDVLIVVQEKEHDLFTREGDDLIIKKSISLTEALTGFAFVVTHLDGRSLLIKSKDGEVIDANALRVVQGEGMPRTRDPSDAGNLFVKLDVVFPPDNFLPAEGLAALEKLLPPRPKEPLPSGEDVEEVNLMPFEESLGSHSQGSSSLLLLPLLTLCSP